MLSYDEPGREMFGLESAAEPWGMCSFSSCRRGGEGEVMIRNQREVLMIFAYRVLLSCFYTEK
jgi:hypothetical protein